MNKIASNRSFGNLKCCCDTTSDRYQYVDHLAILFTNSKMFFHLLNRMLSGFELLKHIKIYASISTLALIKNRRQFSIIVGSFMCHIKMLSTKHNQTIKTKIFFHIDLWQMLLLHNTMSLKSQRMITLGFVLKAIKAKIKAAANFDNQISTTFVFSQISNSDHSDFISNEGHPR